MRIIAAFFIGLLLAQPTQVLAASESPPFTMSELNSLLRGNSMAGNGNLNTPAVPYDWIAFYGSDGVISMRLKPEWGGATGSGKWWVTEKDELCRQFDKMASGKVGCWLVYSEGEFIRFVPSQGTVVEGRAAVIKGNLLKILE
jgi:hypothetical protein